MTLQELRDQIDRIDTKILALLNDRLGLAHEVGEIKRKEGLDIYAPEREEQLLRRLSEMCQGTLLPPTAVRAIYREIISASISLEKALVVAYLGPEATWSHHAARTKFGSSVNYSPQPGIREVFEEVTRQRADFGVVPIENSTEGAVGQTMDEFVESDLKICAEILVPVAHNLVGKQGLADIRRIYSHAQSFGQCRNWLRLNLPGVELVPVASNALAASKAAAEEASAAICGTMAADLHKLRIIQSSIQDNPDNTTRFLVIGRQETNSTGNDKTSLMLVVRDQAGALHHALEPLVRHGLSMSRIESRPTRQKAWTYCFFIDLLGHYSDPTVAEALKDLSQRADLIKVLGSYPITAS